MHALWRRTSDRLATSLWFVPALAGALGVALARGLARVDRIWGEDFRGWFVFGGGAESARQLLATIASSLMTLTGVVFSITILVLQLASQQFSPRVLRTFLEDRATRFSLAAFIGSFVYAMALLAEVRTEGDARTAFVPGVSVYVALVLVLFSVGVFVRYIHQMAHSIRAVQVLARVGTDARRAITSEFPNEPDDADLSAVRPEEARPATGARTIANTTGRAGVIALVDDARLLELATATDAVVEVVPQVGAFVPRGAPLLRIYGEAGCRDDELLESIELADERTPHQDPTFGLRQLVDVAERALSPGINDPTTAVQALDQIHDLLRALAPRRFPSSFRLDDAGRVRVIIPRPSWEDVVHLALDEIRQYGARSIQIVARLRALLYDLLSVAPAHRQAVLRELLAALSAPNRTA